MPKLDGIEFKTLFGKKVDKENDNVFFNDEEHSYLDKNDGSKYISVTTLLHEYQNAFNESFFSKYKALEALSDADKFSWVKQGLLNTQIWKPELVEKLGVDEAEVTPEASFIQDLGADSLDTVELTMEFEKEFGVEIPDTEAENLTTVGAAIAYIEAHMK